MPMHQSGTLTPGSHVGFDPYNRPISEDMFSVGSNSGDPGSAHLHVPQQLAFEPYSPGSTYYGQPYGTPSPGLPYASQPYGTPPSRPPYAGQPYGTRSTAQASLQWISDKREPRFPGSSPSWTKGLVTLN